MIITPLPLSRGSHRDLLLALRPVSINRRIASDRDTPAALAQLSMASTSSTGGRKATSGVIPVAGRPTRFGFFPGVTDRTMFMLYKKGEPNGSSRFCPQVQSLQRPGDDDATSPGRYKSAGWP